MPSGIGGEATGVLAVWLAGCVVLESTTAIGTAIMPVAAQRISASQRNALDTAIEMPLDVAHRAFLSKLDRSESYGFFYGNCEFFGLLIILRDDGDSIVMYLVVINDCL